MEHVHLKSAIFRLHCILPLQNSTIPSQNSVRATSTLHQHPRHPHTAAHKTIRKGILIRPNRLRHINFHVLPLLLYLLTSTRQVADETEAADQQVIRI